VHPLIQQHREQIEQLCRTHHVTRLELFGSAARGDFDPDTNDFDFFVEFEELGIQRSSNRYFGTLHGLEDLLGRQVDLVERRAVKNTTFLRHAESACELIYASSLKKAS
jgi:predicted nucleotidyltransferase